MTHFHLKECVTSADNNKLAVLPGSVNVIALILLEQAIGSSNVIYIRMLEYKSIWKLQAYS